MSKFEKLILKLLLTNSDRNFEFEDLVKILMTVGFDGRIKGSHHIFTKEGVKEIINIQPVSNQAKPYQVKQVREILLKYKLIPNG
jgi:predicted RNA binding protein YcfA (HicA-like mRNA interferase family)